MCVLLALFALAWKTRAKKFDENQHSRIDWVTMNNEKRNNLNVNQLLNRCTRHLCSCVNKNHSCDRIESHTDARNSHIYTKRSTTRIQQSIFRCYCYCIYSYCFHLTYLNSSNYVHVSRSNVTNKTSIFHCWYNFVCVSVRYCCCFIHVWNIYTLYYVVYLYEQSSAVSNKTKLFESNVEGEYKKKASNQIVDIDSRLCNVIRYAAPADLSCSML